MATPKHTPPPWVAEVAPHNTNIYNIFGPKVDPGTGILSRVKIAQVTTWPIAESTAEATADFIVTACNSHYALTAIKDAIKDMMHDIEIFYAHHREPGNKYLVNLKTAIKKAEDK